MEIEGDLDRYKFRWTITVDDSSTPEVASGWALGGDGARWTGRFDKPGRRRIDVAVEHIEVSTRASSTGDYYLDVGESRYSGRYRFWVGLRRLDTLFVIALASLVGLGVRYYGVDFSNEADSGSAMTFGSMADYMGALLWGATAKATTGVLTNFPSWLAAARTELGQGGAAADRPRRGSPEKI